MEVTEKQKQYRSFAHWYALGRLDQIHESSEFKLPLGTGDIARDFSERIAEAVVDNAIYDLMASISIYNEWNRYVSELRQFVVVDLGKESDATYGLPH